MLQMNDNKVIRVYDLGAKLVILHALDRYITFIFCRIFGICLHAANTQKILHMTGISTSRPSSRSAQYISIKPGDLYSFRWCLAHHTLAGFVTLMATPNPKGLVDIASPSN